MQNEKDPELWEIAKRRASFKYHLAVYIVMNIFFWIIWSFTKDGSSNAGMWPLWPMFGWGIGLLFHYLGAFVFHKQNDVEREYDKLTRNK
jgi:hypothetical protein